MSTQPNRTQQQTVDQKLIDGLKKHEQTLTSLVIGGTSLKPLYLPALRHGAGELGRVSIDKPTHTRSNPMKTNRNISFYTPHNPQTDVQLQADFDDLAMRATHGDKRALGAIAIAFGRTLLEEARAVMGDFEQQADDVLQDFFMELLEGQSRFTPAHGRAVAWMCGIIRAMARKHRAECERRWGIDYDP